MKKHYYLLLFLLLPIQLCWASSSPPLSYGHKAKKNWVAQLKTVLKSKFEKVRSIAKYTILKKVYENPNLAKKAYIVGLIGLIGLVIPGLGLLSMPLAIAALIMGYDAKKMDPNNKKARSAIIFGWITIGLLVVVTGIVLIVFLMPVAI